MEKRLAGLTFDAFQKCKIFFRSEESGYDADDAAVF